MLEKEASVITEDEAALYDRQIRLWGLDAQKRLRAARVLLIGVGGLGAEVAKNIVLAGVRLLTLLDDQKVSLQDSCNQFLVGQSDNNTNRAESSLHRTQQLNPMVEVRVDTESSCSKSEQFFEAFDVVCATCCTLSELLRIDDICRRHNIAFFAGDVFGYFGYMFADLHKHEYAEDVVTQTKSDSNTNVISNSGEPPAKKPRIEDEHTKIMKKVSSFAQLCDVIGVDWSLEENATKLRKTPKTYFIIRILLEFRTREGRDPDIDHVDADTDKLKEIAAEVLKSLGIDQDWLDLDFTAHCVSALSPACAITGGILAQEVIKAVSQRDVPHNNFFFYNGLETSGMVDRIG